MIPTILLDELERHDPRALAAVSASIRELGLFFLEPGPAAPPSFPHDLFSQARRFFALPDAAKQRIAIGHSPHFRGYVGVGEESTNGEADLKESFEFGQERPAPPSVDPPPYFRLFGGNQWPDPAVLPGFRPAVDAYGTLMDRVAAAVFDTMVRTLGLPDGTSAGLGEKRPCSFSRLIHYSDPAGYAGEDVRLGEHTDSGMITISVQDSPGLEVRTRDGQWRVVDPPDGTLVVFTGELTALWSHGYYPACVHRVSNATLKDARISAITFFIPALDATLSSLDPVAHPIVAGSEVSDRNPWLLGGGEELRPFVVGEREWDRVNTIFADDH